MFAIAHPDPRSKSRRPLGRYCRPQRCRPRDSSPRPRRPREGRLTRRSPYEKSLPVNIPILDKRDVLSWGRSHRFTHRVARPQFADEIGPAIASVAGTGGVLARGLGRSYGDSGLNDGGGLVAMDAIDRFVDFDEATGVLTAGAGVSLAAIIDLVAKRGFHWFLPVSPGTKFVTLGGAVANDVHGKNHHRAGCFGNHVLSLDLLRSDDSRHTCSPKTNESLFRATVGGLGLTGIIARVRLQMMPVAGPMMETESRPFDSLDAFFALSAEAQREWEYTVAWFDAFAARPRGIFTRARHAQTQRGTQAAKPGERRRLSLPFDLPGFAMGSGSVSAFNALYRRLAARKRDRRTDPYETVLYPLDAISGWNRMYGRDGFYQYQCVIPAAAPAAVAELLATIAGQREGSFLNVLKTFGPRPSPGLLSFPMEGTTVALDFPNHGRTTLAFLDRLDAITRSAGGRLYPAKDSRMSPATFAAGYPLLDEFRRHVDPAFSSSFWRRVMPNAIEASP